MKLKTKLTYGIGILFAMIVALGLLSVKYISNLSADTRNILADNYKSLDYAKKNVVRFGKYTGRYDE